MHGVRMGSMILKIKHKNEEKSCQTKAKKAKNVTKDKDINNVDAKKRAKTRQEAKFAPGADESTISIGRERPKEDGPEWLWTPKMAKKLQF